MKKLVLLAAVALAACQGDTTATGDLAAIRNSADSMEESGSFAVEVTVDLDAPAPLSDVSTTINGLVDLAARRATFEARSSDDDHWTDLVIGDTAYHSRGEITNAADWCAVPVDDIDGDALLQVGPLFGAVPELLRSADDATSLEEASTSTSTAYRVSFPLQETVGGAQIEDDEATIWLDEEGRLVRAEFEFSQPVAGASDPATAQFGWTLSDWGTEVDVRPPPVDEVEQFPDCIL